MNSDLKIGLVVSASVIICLFFVVFSTPSFTDKIVSKQKHEVPSKENAAELRRQKDKSNVRFEYDEDDTSLEFVELDEDEGEPQDNIVESGKDSVAESSDIKKKPDEDTNPPELDIAIDPDLTEKQEKSNEDVRQEEIETELQDDVENKIKIPKDEKKEPLREAIQEDIIYTIKAGDNLTKIARRFYLDSRKHVDISKANNGLHSNNLKIGQKIKLPGISNFKNSVVKKPKPLLKSNLVSSDQDIVYQVKKGDIASIIMRKYYGSSFKYLKEVKKANPKVNLDRLRIGQKLVLPGLGKK